ncbi:MAG: hypothetical protein ACTHLW_11965 [Verrucomicrobiota bacterium]
MQQVGTYLDGFYKLVELRQGNETLLAELRSRARETERCLQRLASTTPKRPMPKYEGWSADESTEAKKTLEATVWDQGGLWQEKPEDGMPGLKSLLEQNYIPYRLPRVVGWRGRDRQRVPEVLRQFVEELSLATNVDLRLEGRFLALLRTPDKAEGLIEDCAQALFNEIWENRRYVLAHPGKRTLLPRAEAALWERRYYQADTNQRFEYEPFLKWVQEIRMDYLQSASVYEDQLFYFLFQRNHNSYSPAEARALLIPIEEFQKRIQPAQPQFRAIVAEIKERAGKAELPHRKAPAIEPWPAETPFVPSYVSWGLKHPQVGGAASVAIREAVIRKGAIWASICYYDQDLDPKFFVRIDVLSGETIEIPFPPDADQVGISTFEILEDSIYVCVGQKLMRFRLSENKWQETTAPLDSPAKITGLNGRLYLSTGGIGILPAGSSLLEFNPDSGAVEVLASSRRRPPVHELDTLWDGSARVFARADGLLGVFLKDRLFAYDPVGRKWSSRVGPAMENERDTAVYCTSAGVQWLSHGLLARHRLVAMWNDKSSPELLLEQTNQFEPKGLLIDQTLGKPRWVWPERFRMEIPTIVPDGSSVWMLHPRVAPWNVPNSEPIKFQDNRTATLLKFESDRTNCLQVPVTLQKEGQPFDFADCQYSAPFCLEGLILLAHDERLVVISTSSPGHWLIPKSELKNGWVSRPTATLGSSPQSSAGKSASVVDFSNSSTNSSTRAK